MKITELKISDPEFAERFEAFANEEVVNEPGIELEEKTRYLAILATLLGCQGIEAFKVVLKEALYGAVTPVEAKEVVYQAVDYLGMGRVFPFINATNEVMTELGIELPLSGQATTTMENRVEMGEQAQVDIFGEGMKGFSKGGHINRWLSGNCFGDYYTRKGLDLKQRELITFCYIVAQGGCEPQLVSHIEANIRLGNDRAFLIKVISRGIPFLGYPRSLNALRRINVVIK